MKIIAFILNIPWTITGILFGLVSIPKSILFSTSPFGIIIHVKSFWWYSWLPQKGGIRAMALGQTVLLGKNILQNDLEHELVHVKQAIRWPFIFPFLYLIESVRRGYRNNKYEVEAYETTESVYTSIMEFTVDNLFVKPISVIEVEDVQYLFNKSLDFFELVEKRKPREGDALDTLTDVPEGKTKEDKISLGVYDGDTLGGIIDIITDYPRAHTWFLGLLLLSPTFRNQGKGKGIYNNLKSLLKVKGVTSVMVSVAEENNKALRFWKSIGFIEKDTKIEVKQGQKVNFVYLEDLVN